MERRDPLPCFVRAAEDRSHHRIDEAQRPQRDAGPLTLAAASVPELSVPWRRDVPANLLPGHLENTM